MEVILRAAAIAVGARRYFTGKPCKYGHIAERHIGGGNCIECAAKQIVTQKTKDAAREYRKKNFVSIKAKRDKWNRDNKEKLAEYKSQWRRDNAAKLQVQAREYRAKNAVRLQIVYAEWRKENAERKKFNDKRWSQANPASVARNNKRWRDKNPEMARIYASNYRARKMRDGGRLSAGLAAKLYRHQRGRCACCGLPLGLNYHLDHIMPLNLGGSNTDNNIQLLRQRCNNQKCDRHPIEFMQSRGWLI